MSTEAINRVIFPYFDLHLEINFGYKLICEKTSVQFGIIH